MIENKQFTFDRDTVAPNIKTPIVFKEGEKLSIGEVLDKLNELHEKKEILELQLKSATNEIDKLMSEIDMLTNTCHDCCKEIRKENKELKKEVQEQERRKWACLREAHRLDLKNEQLKKENKKLKKELEECRNNKLFSRRELENENQLLKQALREMLENSGNKYLIDLFDKIFDLNYYEWEKKMNDTHTYDYVEWEEVLKKRFMGRKV